MVYRYRWAILWMMGIACASFIPGNEFKGDGVDGLDKVIHLFFYLMLTFILAIANLRQSCITKRAWNPVLMATISSFFYGILIEIFQGTVFVSRSFEIMDVLANTLGTLSGAFLFYLIFGNPKYYMPWNTKKPGKLTLKRKDRNF